ncbi:CLUMA_CG013930, isoform A [Clunio marinus]|uniref:CLUMA_CG013930, isoform A n=1 Tax=Clunio marinus TaxID=568069 RepID=A0A1J1INK2_9DIPT|nr:CLUMA_CG013930, isoform A [Clunio marinus]
MKSTNAHRVKLPRKNKELQEKPKETNKLPDRTKKSNKRHTLTNRTQRQENLTSSHSTHHSRNCENDLIIMQCDIELSAMAKNLAKC